MKKKLLSLIALVAIVIGFSYAMTVKTSAGFLLSFDSAEDPVVTLDGQNSDRGTMDYARTSVISGTPFLNVWGENNSNGSKLVAMPSDFDFLADNKEWTMEFDWAVFSGCNGKAGYLKVMAGTTELFAINDAAGWGNTCSLTGGDAEGLTVPCFPCNRSGRISAVTGDSLNQTAYWQHFVVIGNAGGISVSAYPYTEDGQVDYANAHFKFAKVSDVNLAVTQIQLRPGSCGSVAIDQLSVKQGPVTYTVSDEEITYVPAVTYIQAGDNADVALYNEAATSTLANQSKISGGVFVDMLSAYGGTPVTLVKADLSDLVAHLPAEKVIEDITLDFTATCTVSSKNSEVKIALIEKTDWDITTATWNATNQAEVLGTLTDGSTGVWGQSAGTAISYNIKDIYEADADKVLAFGIYTATGREQAISDMKVTVKIADNRPYYTMIGYECESELTAGSAFVLAAELGDSLTFLAGPSTSSTTYGMPSIVAALPEDGILIDSKDMVIAEAADTLTDLFANGAHNFELEAGATEGTWKFKDAVTGKYLAWSSGNSLKQAEEGTDFKVSFYKDNSAIIEVASAAGRTLQYNTQSPRFACYTSTQAKVYLYKKGTKTSVVNRATPFEVPTFSKIADLKAYEWQTGVTVAMASWYVSSNSGKNLYVKETADATDSLLIYANNIPEEYLAGGKLTGTVTGVWTLYNGIWELTNIVTWDELSYAEPGRETIYERGYATAWTSADLAEGEWWYPSWCAGNGAKIDATKGLYMYLTASPVTGFGWAAEMGRTIAHSADAKLYINAVFHTGANTGAETNYSYLKMAGFEIRANQQNQYGYIVANGTEITIPNACSKTGGNRGDDTWTIYAEVNTASHVIDTISISGIAASADSLQVNFQATDIYLDPTDKMEDYAVGHTRSKGTPGTEALTKLSVEEKTMDVQKAKYTVKYMSAKQVINVQTLEYEVDWASATECKAAVEREGVVGDTIVGSYAEDTQDWYAYDADGEATDKYLYDHNDAGDFKVAADGSTAVTIYYKEARKAQFTLVANYAGKQDTLGVKKNAIQGDKVTLYYPEFILDGDSLWYYPAGVTTTSQYTYDYTMGDAKKTQALDYVDAYTSIDCVDTLENCRHKNVVFFKEAEDIDGFVAYEDGYTNIRLSMGKGGYMANDVKLVTLPAGKYMIALQERSNNSPSFNFKVAGATDDNGAAKDVVTLAGGSGSVGVPVDSFCISHPVTVIAEGLGEEFGTACTTTVPASPSGVIDWIMIKKIGDVEETPYGLSKMIADAVNGKQAGETATIELTEDVELGGIVTNPGLVNVVINGNGHKVTVAEGGQIVTQQALFIYDVNFDCANATVAPVAMAATPDESLYSDNEPWKTLFDGANQKVYHDTLDVILVGCNFSDLKAPLFSDGGAKWALGSFVVDDCNVQFNGKIAGGTYIQFDKGGNSIKNIDIKNSTMYNVVEDNDIYFLRYSNSSNAQPQKVWGTDATAEWNMTNNTFVNLASNKNFANNYPSKNNVTLTWKGNIFYNVWRLQKAVGNCVANFTAADNVIKGVTNEVDASDKSKYATEDTLLVFNAAETLDLDNVNLAPYFTPGMETLAGQNMMGDPDWKAFDYHMVAAPTGYDYEGGMTEGLLFKDELGVYAAAGKWAVSDEYRQWVKYSNPTSAEEVQTSNRWGYIDPSNDNNSGVATTAGITVSADWNKTVSFFVTGTTGAKFYYTGSGGTATQIQLFVTEAGAETDTIPGTVLPTAGKNKSSAVAEVYGLDPAKNYNITVASVAGDNEVYYYKFFSKPNVAIAYNNATDTILYTSDMLFKDSLGVYAAAGKMAVAEEYKSWVVYHNAGSTNEVQNATRNLRLDPATEKECDATAMAASMVVSANKCVDFYVTGSRRVDFILSNSGGASAAAYAKVWDMSGTYSAADSIYGGETGSGKGTKSAVLAITDLDPAKPYLIEVWPTAGDMQICTVSFWNEKTAPALPAELPEIAENAFYSWQSPKGTVEEVGGVATAYGDTVRVNYANAAQEIQYYNICLCGKTFEDKWVEIAFNEGVTLNAGDTIYVYGYKNKGDESKKATIKFNAGDTEWTGGDDFKDCGIAGNAPNTVAYVVPAGVVDATSLKLTRGTAGTNIFIPQLYIVKGEQPTGISEINTESSIFNNGAIYNLRGQKVENLKAGEIYIQNGKKFIIK